MRIAVIPARGGSKRIPRKNVRPFCGKAMICWPIEAALASDCFDRVLVSTDDPEIARTAESAGAEAPFVRPPELCGDHTPTSPVIAHAIEWVQAQGQQPEAVCCIYATAAFLRPTDLIEGYKALVSTGSAFAFSVTSFPAPIQRALRITAAGRVEMFSPENFLVRSQDLEPAYHDAAQFYWGRPEAWLSGRPIFSSAAAPVLLPRNRVQDIDTPEDWAAAELMFRNSDHHQGTRSK